MSVKRVLVFGLTYQVGGVESFVMTYYKNIDRSKIQFDFISFCENLAYREEFEKLGGKIYVFPSRNKHPIKNYKELEKFFIKNSKNYIAIHLHLCDASNITALNLAKKYKIPIRIVHSHNNSIMQGGVSGVLRNIAHNNNVTKVIKNSTDYFSCSKLAGSWFFGEDILDNPNHKIINNAIDTNKYIFDSQIRDEVVKELELEGKFVVGHVGRFHSQKNHIFLIDIFKELTKLNKNAILLLVGNGELLDEVKLYVKKLKLLSFVKFLNVRSDVNRLMQAMDIFLLPSLYEGFGIVLIEAQAAGLKCFASKEKIPMDTKCTDLIEYISLSNSPSEWAKLIFNSDLNYERKNMQEKIKDAGYDIKAQSLLLEEFYINRNI